MQASIETWPDGVICCFTCFLPYSPDHQAVCFQTMNYHYNCYRLLSSWPPNFTSWEYLNLEGPKPPNGGDFKRIRNKRLATQEGNPWTKQWSVSWKGMIEFNWQWSRRFVRLTDSAPSNSCWYHPMTISIICVGRVGRMMAYLFARGCSSLNQNQGDPADSLYSLHSKCTSSTVNKFIIETQNVDWISCCAYVSLFSLSFRSFSADIGRYEFINEEANKILHCLLSIII